MEDPANFPASRPTPPRPPAGEHDASPITLAVVMTAIGAFFVMSIAAAFIYAKDTNHPSQQAAAPLPPPASYQKAPSETTGSGGGPQQETTGSGRQ